MANPSPELLAKVLLWQLCGARVEIASLKGQMDDLAAKLGNAPTPDYVQSSLQEDKAHQLALYRSACRDLGIDEVPPIASSGNDPANN